MTLLKKIWYVLPSKYHSKVIILLLLLLFGMGLEMLGVGLVIPILVLLTDGDFVTKYPTINPMLDNLGNPTHEQLIVMSMFLMVVVYVVKSIFLGFSFLFQSKFIHFLEADIAQILYKGYLHQPYTFHLQRNSAELIRNTINHAGGVASLVQQSTLLVGEIFILTGVSILLFLVEPVGALSIVSMFGCAGLLFHWFTRGHILRWGKTLQWHNGFRIQHLQQGLGGVKSVKLLGREQDFLDQFSLHNQGTSKIRQYQHTLQALPRLLLETLAIAGLATLVITMISQGKSISTLLPTVGLFAAAAFRIMPSVNRIINSAQGLRFGLPIIDTIYSEFHILKKDSHIQCKETNFPFQMALHIEHIKYKYPSTETLVLNNVDLVIHKGKSIGFIGGSGAGKTTLIDIILGLIKPDSGAIMIDGVDIQSNIRGWQDLIGYVPQSIYLTDDTLRRNIAFGIPDDKVDESAILRAMRDAQLDEFISELPDGLDTLVGERGVRISGGQQQRIGIARALYHNPSVLVLDEASSSLDTETETSVMKAVYNLQGEKTIIIIAHRLSTIQNCDYVYKLEKGKIIDTGSAYAESK